MTEKSIIEILAGWVDNRKYPYQIPCAFIYGHESDYWIMDSNGNTKEFEIKCSYQDFKNDAKKDKHKNLGAGANFFYFVCPKGLISKYECPQKYGLIYIWETGHVSIEKKPQRLNNNKFDQWKMLANKMYWKWYTLWKAKKVAKEISHTEYWEGFNIDLDAENRA